MGEKQNCLGEQGLLRLVKSENLRMFQEFNDCLRKSSTPKLVFRLPDFDLLSLWFLVCLDMF